jgi:hypothetical protein
MNPYDVIVVGARAPTPRRAPVDGLGVETVGSGASPHGKETVL